jgi:hypothetical protein
VQGRIGDVKARLVLGQCFGEPGRVRTVGRIGNADDLGLMSAQQGLKVEITRIVNQNGVAGAQQKPADQVDRLCPRPGQQNLIGADGDAVIGDLAGQKPAQVERPARAAVIRQHGIVGAGKAADRPADGGVRHPACGKPAASRFQHVRAGVQRLPRHPERIDRLVEPGAHLGKGQRRGGPGNEKARTGARADHAFGGQPVIGLDDG